MFRPTCVPVPVPVCVCVFFENRAPARSRQSAATGDARIGSDLVRPVPRSALGIVIFVRLSSLVRVRPSACPCVSIGTTERRVQDDDDDDDDDGVTDEAGVGAVDTGIVTAGWNSRVVVVVVVVVARGRERTRGETKSGARAPTRRRRRTKGAARAEKDARGES